MNLTLKTDRLLLRPLVETDVDLCLDQFTDPEVMKYLREPMTREQVLGDMPKRCQRGGGGCIGIWCLVDRVTAEKLGTAILLPLPIDLDDIDWSLVRGPDFPPGDIQIGYILKRLAWGKGYATEACGRLLQFAFEETPLREIVAVTDRQNAASQYVLTKCGFARDGNRRAYNCNDVPGFRIGEADWSATVARR
jgi:ribosomal-protein-alanine N-acetyltransferase